MEETITEKATIAYFDEIQPSIQTSVPIDQVDSPLAVAVVLLRGQLSNKLLLSLLL